jgi:hypothetical protein
MNSVRSGHVFQGPIFIVGCSRSGTTLVQSVLAHLPGRISFPETNILYRLIDELGYQRFGMLIGPHLVPVALICSTIHRVGFTIKDARPKFLEYISQLGRDDLSYLIPYRMRRLSTAFETFAAMMAALSEGKPWVEKTPQNIFCLSLIEKYIPKALFIHVIRNGQDNVASLIDAAKRYSVFNRRFGGAVGLAKAVRYWNTCLRISYAKRGKPGHVFIRYEDIVAQPLSAFKGVEIMIDQKIKQEYLLYNTQGIVFESEAWKMKGNKTIHTQEKKYHKLFNTEQQRYVTLNALNVDEYFPRTFGKSIP